MYACTVAYTGQVTINKVPEKHGHIYLVRLYLRPLGDPIDVLCVDVVVDVGIRTLPFVRVPPKPNLFSSVSDPDPFGSVSFWPAESG